MSVRLDFGRLFVLIGQHQDRLGLRRILMGKVQDKADLIHY